MVTKKMPPTAKKRRGDSVARSSKKQKVMAVEFDMPLPDDPDEEGGGGVSVRGDTGEKSTRTCDMVQFWSDHHQPTHRFVSHQE